MTSARAMLHAGVRLLLLGFGAVALPGCLVTGTVQAWSMPEVHVLGVTPRDPRLLVNIKNVAGVEDGEYEFDASAAATIGLEDLRVEAVPKNSRVGDLRFPFPMMIPWSRSLRLTDAEVAEEVELGVLETRFGHASKARWIGYQLLEVD